MTGKYQRTLEVMVLHHCHYLLNDGFQQVVIMRSDLSIQNKVEALVSGIAVIDPRTDPNCLGRDDKSKKACLGSSYTNPACCILTYLLDPVWGMGLEVEDVDITSFILLSNYADNKQLKFNGFVNQDSTFGEILKDFAEKKF